LVRRQILNRLRNNKQRAADLDDIRDELGMWQFPDNQVVALAQMNRAVRVYKPRPYAGRALVFRPRTLPLLGRRPVPDLGWGRLALGGVEVQAVNGSHETMLRYPFVVGLAAALRRAIDEAIGVRNPGHSHVA
jgi:hypothetical protein